VPKLYNSVFTHCIYFLRFDFPISLVLEPYTYSHTHKWVWDTPTSIKNICLLYTVNVWDTATPIDFEK